MKNKILPIILGAPITFSSVLERKRKPASKGQRNTFRKEWVEVTTEERKGIIVGIRTLQNLDCYSGEYGVEGFDNVVYIKAFIVATSLSRKFVYVPLTIK